MSDARSPSLQEIVDEINQNYLDKFSRPEEKDAKKEGNVPLSEADLAEQQAHDKLFQRLPIPREDVWCFGLDERDQGHNDPYYYDKPRLVSEENGGFKERSEPGYKAGMEKTFLLMIRTLHLPLSEELIVSFHDMSISTVEKLKNKKGVRESYNTYDIVEKVNVTYEGLVEMFANYQSFCRFQDVKTQVIAVNPETCFKTRHQKVDPRSDEKTSVKVKACFNEFIKEYESKIKEAKTDFEKIFTIADFIHKCEILHPFLDGNIRSLVFSLANWLLLKNGFPPAIFYDPNRFDGYSTLQLCREIMNGIRKTCFAYKDTFPFTDQLKKAEDQIVQEIELEKKLLSVERKIRTFDWELRGSGVKITIDQYGTQKKVPPAVARQWVIIQDAIHRKKPLASAWREVQSLGVIEAGKQGFFHDMFCAETTRNYYQTFVEKKSNQP